MRFQHKMSLKEKRGGMAGPVVPALPSIEVFLCGERRQVESKILTGR